jgi:hypothetical protein
MRYLIPLLFPLFLFAETTDNLLNQTYFNGTTPINGWSGTNDHSHGGSIIAGVHGEYLENTITLGDTLNQSQMNGGWTSTFGSDIWHWNDYQSTVRMTQTITGADGTITTQVRDVVSSPCGGNNCGSYVTYTDSYTQGINNQSNFDIKVRYDFSDTSQSSSHWSPDIKNPTLIIEHSLLDTTQVAELKTVNETVYNVAEDIDSYEYIPEQEFTFEITEQPIIEMSMVEEFNFEPQAIEELNAGVVDVFQEIPYDNQATFKEIPTEIKVEEVFVETRESFNETKVEEFAEEIISEEITAETPVEEATPEPMEQTESNVSESKTEATVASEEVNETIGERETTDSGSGNGGVETVIAREETLEGRDTEVEEGRVEGNTTVNTQTISIESIEKKVNETLKRVDQRLVATSLIIAKAMKSNISLDNYSRTNNNIFNNQLNIDGGNYNDQREYVDLRDIYAENQNVYNDSMAQRQTNIQQSIDEVIRTQEHLRRIRGY